MKTEKITIDNEDVWFSVEECYSSLDEKFLGYISFFNTEKPGLFLGEATKDKNFKYIIFDSESKALAEARKYYELNDLKKYQYYITNKKTCLTAGFSISKKL